jgi:hypothetical protein
MSLMAFARDIRGKPFAMRSAADCISSVEYVPLKTRISIALGIVRVGGSSFLRFFISTAFRSSAFL